LFGTSLSHKSYIYSIDTRLVLDIVAAMAVLVVVAMTTVRVVIALQIV